MICLTDINVMQRTKNASLVQDAKGSTVLLLHDPADIRSTSREVGPPSGPNIVKQKKRKQPIETDDEDEPIVPHRKSKPPTKNKKARIALVEEEDEEEEPFHSVKPVKRSINKVTHPNDESMEGEYYTLFLQIS